MTKRTFKEKKVNSSTMQQGLNALMDVLFKLTKPPHGTNRRNETMQATVDDTESLSMNQYMSPDYLELATQPKTFHPDSTLTSVGEPSLRVFTIPFGYLDASLFSEYEDFDDEDFLIETSYSLDDSYKFTPSEEDEDLFNHLIYKTTVQVDHSLLGLYYESDIHKMVSDSRDIANELENEQKLKSFDETDSYKLTDSGIQHVKNEGMFPKSCKKKTKIQAGRHEMSASITGLKSSRSRTRGGGLQEDSIRRRAKRKRNSKTDNIVHM
ncbi:2257_t:CDS:1 [Paraglomus brasilianum]|uniref:2257_t:CDS:1 n=1 Tax=Paraglomus brasilianum TaxID=144538 RepID=A0A9N9B0E5_9GLOM|nr:2257_t:CDS:1 [Paraglomus brasilianum]